MNEELMKKFKGYFKLAPTDRSGFFTALEMPTVSSHPIPTMDHALTDDIGILIDQRAAEISAITGKHIYLMWSGGIDSTTVFYSLVNAGVTFTVIYSENSSKEYPMLYAEIMAGTFINVDTLIKTSSPTIDPLTSIIVTGEIADQLFGHMLFSNLNQAKRNTLLSESNFPEDLKAVFLPAVESVFGDSTLMTLGEYIWSMNFMFKYYNVTQRIKTIPAFADKDMLNFFDTTYFQQWSMNNYKTNVSYIEFTDYKMPLKNYIFLHNGDAVYQAYKTKVPSLRFLSLDDTDAEGNRNRSYAIPVI